MVRSSSDHGVFTWTTNNENVFIGLATDDILVCSETRAPFLLLKQELELLFDLTLCPVVVWANIVHK
jgi:hypothetical protein